MMDNLEPLTTDGGRIVKMEVDYSSTCDEKIAIAESLAANGKLQEALDTLLMLEKQTRTVSFCLYHLSKCYIFFHFLTFFLNNCSYLSLSISIWYGLVHTYQLGNKSTLLSIPFDNYYFPLFYIIICDISYYLISFCVQIISTNFISLFLWLVLLFNYFLYLQYYFFIPSSPVT